MDPAAPTVSVVIPALNAEATLRRTLDAVVAQAPGGGDGSLEVIVADDGSTDGTMAIVASYGDVVRAVPGAHSGPGAARNRGVEASTGEVLVFVDGDDIPLAGWLQQIHRAFRDPDVGLASWPVSVETVELSTKEVWRKRPGGPEGFVGLPGCFAVRRTVFDAVGGYDGALRMAENSDLCARLRARCVADGLRIASMPEVTMEIVRAKELTHYDRYRVDAMEHLLQRDAEAYAAQPRQRAHLHAMAAVNAARCSEWKRARRHAILALRDRPTDPKAYARVAGTLLPFLGRRLWVQDSRRRRVSMRQVGVDV